MSLKNKSARWSNSKHRWLGLIGGISLLIWGLSGLSHIAMVLFGPQQVQFRPPTAQIELTGAQPIAQTLASNGIGHTVAVQTVPAADETAIWQVTENAMSPRRYFQPANGVEIPEGDKLQAEFLARHFLGTGEPVKSAVLQTEFDGEYPWVNRLLPVWKLEFAGDDNLTAYVNTETSSLAAVNNTAKSRLQTMFRWMHTWEWVPDGMDWLRVVVMALMVGSLFALAATGIAMLIAVRRKKRAPGAKGWHRVMGYVLALPLIMFSVSGIYHLIQSALIEPVSELRMARAMNVENGSWPIEQDWASLSEGRDIASISLVEGDGGKALYRVGLAPPKGAMGGGEHDHGGADTRDDANRVKPVAASNTGNTDPQTDAEIREARFIGIKPNGPAIYIDAATGELEADGDRENALSIARRFSGAPDTAVTNMEIVTRFSHEYDFRNKRLPVWRVDYGAPVNATLFVDTKSGALVDKLANWQKTERFVFSMVHKWNFLYPIGRLGLNIVVGLFVIALVIFMAILGLRMDWKNRRLRKWGRRKTVEA